MYREPKNAPFAGNDKRDIVATREEVHDVRKMQIPNMSHTKLYLERNPFEVFRCVRIGTLVTTVV